MRAVRALAAALLTAVLPFVAAGAEPVDAECPPIFFGEAGTVECFAIDVPERHEMGNGGHRVTLFVSVLRAASDAPRSDPVVYLAGGPGATAAEAAPLLADSLLRETRDIILFEQRGTALSDPFLGCPALDLHESFFAAAPDTDERFAEVIGHAAARCADVFEADGVDLDAYMTTASVEDLELVRRALGIKSWNLYGSSYGTRLALEVLRHHPESVRSAVLDAVDPPDRDRIGMRTPNLAAAVAAADEACDADQACAQRFGDLDVLLERALERWRDEPTLVFAPYSTDAYTELVVDPGAVAGLVYSTLATDPSTLPLLLEQLADGDTTIFELTDLGPGLLAEGLRLSIECAESIARADPSAIRVNDAAHPDLALAFRRFPEPVACPRWPVGPSSASSPEPVSSDVPVLLVSGGLDPITPPSVAAHAARSLGRAQHHVVPIGGHGAGIRDRCAIEVRDAFIADPDAPLPQCDTATAFLTDAVDQPALARAWRTVFAPAPPQIPSMLPAIAVVGGALAAVLIGSAVAMLKGSRSWAVRGVALSAGLLLGIGVVIAWGWLSQPPIVGMVGLPALLGWVPWATPLVACAGVVTLVFVGSAVTGSGCRRRARLMLAASALPVAAGITMLVANGLALPPF